MLRKSFHDRCLLTLASARGRKERRKRYRGKKKKCDPLGCSLIALFQCCMFCLLSDWVKWLFLLAYLRVALQQPVTSSDSVLYLNLLDPFTSSPVVMQTASVPMVSQIRVFCGQNNLPFSSGRFLPFFFKKNKQQLPCTSALLLRQTPFLSVLVFSLASSQDSLHGFEVYMRMNFFDIALLCCSRNKRKQFVPDHKYFASRETFFLLLLEAV